ncbi:MAG TPA: hypothetical protein VGN04_13400 [Herbaspirillum sp.]|jgi:predicted small lipoprotein YifL
MRSITTVFVLLGFLSLTACGEKADYERKAEQDAAARRIVNTKEK